VSTPYDRRILAPFRGLRYTKPHGNQTAPPYDVLNTIQAQTFREQDSENIVHLDLPLTVGDAGSGAEADSLKNAEDVEIAHKNAAASLTNWVDQGVLGIDETPSFYIYRQEYSDTSGKRRQTLGVVGALRIGDPNIQPHEEITKKAASDRLASLNHTKTNISMIYCLSTAANLGSLLISDSPSSLDFTDENGVRHTLQHLDSSTEIDALAASVQSAPVIIADGHHRYTMAKKYYDSLPTKIPGSDRIMALIVPLDPAHLLVRSIQRSLPSIGLTGSALREAIETVAFVTEDDPERLAEIAITDGDEEIGFVAEGKGFRLRPRPAAQSSSSSTTLQNLPAVWTRDVLLPAVKAETRVFHQDPNEVIDWVKSGEQAGAVILPPVTIAQITSVANAQERMPPKTTFFWPKARTGLVLRRFLDQENKSE